MSFEYSRGRGRPAQGLNLEDMRRYAVRHPSYFGRIAAYLGRSPQDLLRSIQEGGVRMTPDFPARVARGGPYRLTLEDMRQYAERDPSAMTKLAAHFEVSTSEVASRIEAGAMSQAAARRALGDAPWMK